MSGNQKMYKEAVLDHYRNPRNYGDLKEPDVYVREDNPLCGDEVSLYFNVDQGKIHEVRFNGRGCAISLASASMLSEAMLGKSIDTIDKEIDEARVMANLGIEINPMRIKCAVLCLDVLRQGVTLYRSGKSRRVQDAAAQGVPAAAEQRHSLIDSIGGTPLFRLSHAVWGHKPTVQIWAKMEGNNPGGSAKARAAISMIRYAIKSNQTPLLPGMTIIEATTGTGGIPIAMLGAQMGFPVKLILPSNTSEAVKNVLRAYGAELLVLLDETMGLAGAAEIAKAAFKKEPSAFCYLDTTNNPAAWKAHHATTGPEILQQSAGQVTHLVAGIGTGATLIGTARYLKEQNGEIKAYGVVPATAADRIDGLRHLESEGDPAILDRSFIDEILPISAKEATETTKRLAKREGLLVGTSSGAALAASLQLAARLDGGTIVAIFPDDGQPYLEQPHWAYDF